MERIRPRSVSEKAEEPGRVTASSRPVRGTRAVAQARGARMEAPRGAGEVTAADLLHPSWVLLAFGDTLGHIR